MIKSKSNKSKTKGLFKGVALGFAFVLCGAFFPVTAIQALADDWKGSEATTNTHRIQVDGKLESNENSATVIKGDTYTIPVGEYYSGATKHTIGSNVSGNITTSKVEVLYKATGDLITSISGVEEGSVAGNVFTASRLGTYVIRYTVVDSDVEYSYDFEVESQASEATFEFKANDKNIIPTVYDTKLASKMENKNIVLPLPTVNDEEGEAILTSADKEYYVLDRNGAGVPTDKGCFVYVSLSSGDDTIQIKTDGETGDFYIDGNEILEKAESLDGTEFKITYSFYQIRENDNKSFITSTSRTFTVRDGYYYKTSDEKEGEEGYDIVTSWSTSVPDSAVVGVEKELPTISATTKSNNSPASESVSVYYELQVLKMDDNGRYTKDVTVDVITEDQTFKAKEEGSYRFIYTVKDFYGNQADTTNTTFTINNVKDTQSAEVYMYDAGDYTKDEEDGSYSSAENKLKTQTVTRNIIMYAIGGSDNMVAEDQLVLRREIRDASTVTRFRITEAKYNKYNLIFAPGTTDGELSMDAIYKQIVSDNFEIYKQMVQDKKSPTDAGQIKQWLLDNNYLLVTTEWNKDPAGNAIITEGNPAENDSAAIDEMITKGFAFVKPTTTNGKYNFTEQNYSFYYFANDSEGNKNDNKERSKYYTVKLTSTESEDSIPSVTFPTDLQTTYLPNETIEFDVATASDTVDSRIETVTAYRFLNAEGTTVTNSDTTKTLSYVVRNYNKNDENKWYVSNKDGSTGLVESTGWFYDVNENSYKIDLKDAPADAVSVEIFTYAVDDYGNVGFFNKIVKIATAVDTEMPTLSKVINAPKVDTGAQDYDAPDTISLPTLYYTSSNPEYVSAKVEMYKITEADGQSTKKLMQTTNMQTKADTYRGVFTVDAGIFNVSTEGTYQLIVTITDSSNHSLSTYFTYNVGGGAIVEDPEIDNITSEPIEAAIDTPLYLNPPTVNVSESTTYGYIGLDESDDSNTATYYTTTMVSASNNDYELTQSWFTGNSKGTYKLQYNVFLMRYEKAKLIEETSEEAGIFLKDGKLKYKEAGAEQGADGTSYFIYFEETAEGYELVANTQLNGLGTDLSDTSVLDSLVTKFVLVSDIQTITVGDIAITISIDEDAYSKTQYPIINTEKPNEIRIVKPDVQIQGNGSIDREESYVQITCTSGSSTSTLATIYLDEWQESIDNESENFRVDEGNIFLRLIRNGKYTIRYSVQAQDNLGQNVGDAKTLEYTISNGDVVEPTIDFADNFVKDTYKLGDTLVLNMAGLTVSDKVTTDADTLLETLEVRLTNNDTDESWTLENTAESGYAYEHDLDQAGDYTLTISVRDAAGNRAEKSVSFTVSTDATTPVNVQEVLGGILIGLSVAVLAGVVIYFVVSKVKLDKKEKGYKVNNSKDKNDKQ